MRARAIVLVSDNPPNCTAKPQISSDFAEKLDVEVHPLVEQSFVAGIPTIVVGISVMDVMAPPAAGDSMIDDVNPHEYFNALALAGGAAQAGPEHYLHLRDSAAVPEVIAGLRERLAPLADEVDACRIRIDAALTTLTSSPSTSTAACTAPIRTAPTSRRGAGATTTTLRSSCVPTPALAYTRARSPGCASAARSDRHATRN
ncbi:hypothetical protein [Nannocystis pusilla]|uniref:hypothetical protein n=1 Tax=Nannocystis pusilla TaxID=889268 RepID=UPI003B7FC2EC